ncbi:MAG TPA: VWA domain-containing protein [Pyrinomonadaceae bacterium]|nr:VWA domain-containing protein [Pyrinomonadaceae bacterium]
MSDLPDPQQLLEATSNEAAFPAGDKRIVFGAKKPTEVAAPLTGIPLIIEAPFPYERTLQWLPAGSWQDQEEVVDTEKTLSGNEDVAPVAESDGGESDEQASQVVANGGNTNVVVSQEVLIKVNEHVSQTLEREIGGFLLGNRYRCPNSHCDYVIIDQYSPAKFTESTEVRLAFTHEAWAQISDELSGKFLGKLLIGWYHSHPRLDVFLSSHDMEIQTERFSEPWNVALVMEPEKHHGGFFCARDGRINPNLPVDFFELLERNSRDSVIAWENYRASTTPVLSSTNTATPTSNTSQELIDVRAKQTERVSGKQKRRRKSVWFVVLLLLLATAAAGVIYRKRVAAWWQQRMPKISRLFAGALIVCLLMPLGLLAQSPNPASLSRTADEVNKEGYLLKPSGLKTNEWPILRVDFSIERADKTVFKNLTVADVEPKIDGKRVLTNEGDLTLKDSKRSGVFLLLDGSGSMSAGGVDKLGAAKQGINTLIDNLDADDRVGLIVFDEEPRVLLNATADKARVKQEIQNFSIRKEKSRFTRLYDAVDYGLRRADEDNIENLLLISDGWEDTPETRSMSAAAIETLKRDRERQITEFSRNNGIRVFTVAIGDEHGKGLNYVDRSALDNISKGANGGVAAYIELTGGAQSLDQNYLLGRLQQTLNDLRQSFAYSYSLTVRVDESMQSAAKEHKLWVGFTVGDNPRIQLPIEYTYLLQASGAPLVTTMTVQQAIFISSAPRTVSWQQLLLIYFLLLSVLILLAFIPSVVKTLWIGGQSLKLRKAIVKVGGKSPFIDVACPNEGTAAGRVYLFKEGDLVLVCPNRDCRTPHHLSCWAFNEHQCMQRNCETELVIPAAVLEKHGLIERRGGEETSWMTS